MKSSENRIKSVSKSDDVICDRTMNIQRNRRVNSRFLKWGSVGRKYKCEEEELLKINAESRADDFLIERTKEPLQNESKNFFVGRKIKINKGKNYNK